MLSRAPVSEPDASKMPSKVCKQLELAETIHMPVGIFFPAKNNQLTWFLNMGFFDSACSFCLSLPRKALLSFHQKSLLSAEHKC